MSNPRVVIHPTVVLAAGPSAGTAIRLAREQLAKVLGGTPPFHAYLAIAPGSNGTTFRLTLGDQEREGTLGPDAGRVSELGWPLLREAISHVTDMGRNQDHGIWRGFANAMDRLEIVVAAFADETDAMEELIRLADNAREEVPTSRRIAVIWRRVFENLPTTEHQARLAQVGRSVEFLERAQARIAEIAPRNPFQACLMLDAPLSGAQASITRTDAVGVTSLFLSLLLGSAAGEALRTEMHPQPGPTWHRLGIVGRRHDPAEVERSLVRLWLREAGKYLSRNPVLAEGTGAGQEVPVEADGIKVDALLDGDASTADEALARHRDAVLARAAVTASDIEGSLARAASILSTHADELHRIRSEWVREREKQHKEHEAWKLRSAPPASIQFTEPSVVQTLRWYLLPLVLAPLAGLLIWAGVDKQAIEPWWILGAIGIAVLAVPFLFGKRSESRVGAAANPAYRAHSERGARIESRLAQVDHIVGEAEPQDHDEVQPTLESRGLWGSICLVEAAFREVVLARARVEQMGEDHVGEHGWFIRNVVSQADLERIFRRAVSSADRSPRDGLVEQGGRGLPHRVQRALPSGLESLIRDGHEAFLATLEAAGHELFEWVRDLTVEALLDEVGRGHPNGNDGAVVFFNALAQGSTVLWKSNLDRVTRSKTVLIYSPTWPREVVQRGVSIIGDCQPIATVASAEVVLLRLQRIDAQSGFVEVAPAEAVAGS